MFPPASLTDSLSLFTETVADSRHQFATLAAAAPRALFCDHYPCPAPSPDGSALFTDVAWLGSDGAHKVLVLISGTHGAEGWAGSAVQADFLTEATRHNWQPPA
ncbi:MAG: hypothetical protein CVV10_08350, partial [Gammaproteobacteria bacterium HGW-Gammaproteobacteria-14]